jgi:hypothetical protein
MRTTYFFVCVCACVRGCGWVRRLVHMCAPVAYLYSRKSACSLLLSVAFLTPPNFRDYLRNVTIFGKMLLNIKCVF